MMLQIANVGIRQDSDGRYCLNDLHKAAGGEEKHSPNRWTRTAGYQSLCDELTPELAFAPSVSNQGGSNAGTFVTKELVYAYAMWISPAFNLKVIRTFDAVQTQPVINDPTTRALIQLLTDTDALKSRVALLEAQTTTRDESYFTAAGYCNLKGVKLDRAGMAMIGKMAAQYSRENNLKVGRVYDSRYGSVNEYHTSALQYAVQA